MREAFRLVVGGRRFRLSHHLDGLAGTTRTTTTRRATGRSLLVVGDRRRLVGDDSRRGARTALLQGVNRSRTAAFRNDPELNPAVEVRVTRFVRTGIAEVAHGDACRINTLLVDQIVAGVVGARERDADAL